LLVVLAVAACSKAPASVTPTRMASGIANYDNWTCEELTAERLRMSIAASVAEPDTSITKNPRTGASEAEQSDGAAITKALEAKGCSPAQAFASGEQKPSPPKPRKAPRYSDQAL
jgi:hypothetical protein